MVSGDFKICPYCKESIRAKASKCRYCYSDLTGENVPSENNDANGPLPVKVSSAENVWNVWWMKSLAAIIVIFILILIGLSVSKITNSQREEETLINNPTVVNTGNEAIDTWVNASNFLSSKQGGLYALHAEFLDLLAEDDTFQNYADIETKANELRSIDAPPVLHDLYIEYLVGINLLVDSANYAMQGDWNMATPTLNNGFDLTIEALEKMSERVMEELEKALKEE